MPRVSAFRLTVGIPTIQCRSTHAPLAVEVIGQMRKRALVICGVLAVLILPIHASADSGSGSQPAAKQFTPRDFARADAKHALAIELSQVRNGQLDAAKFNQNVSAFLAQYGPATFASPRLLAAVPMDPTPSNRSLAVTQYPELSPAQYCQAGAATCYCGPSAAESVLQYLKPTS